jgi:hypothetical protein
MKKRLLLAIFLFASVSAFFPTVATVGPKEFEYYEDPDHSIEVGYRAYGACYGFWGVTSAYYVATPCWL